MTVAALIVAAGTGQRLGGGVPKQYRPLAAKPVLRHAVEAIAGHPRIDHVRVVVSEDHRPLAQATLDGLDVGALIIGGATRQASVFNGLMAIEVASAPASVLIHDAARPFVPPAVVDRLLDALADHRGAVPALPVADTLVDRDGATVPRDHVFRVQTPQAFDFAAVLEAHRRWPGTETPTDDAQMVRDAGHPVSIVKGDEALEKLTTVEDWQRAEAMLASGLVARSGTGFDVHAFGGEGPIMIGGIAVPHPRGLSGHSDADVVLHAITDAVLGAAALGDIGEHFPPSDPQWKGAASHLFLAHAATLVRQAGGIIDHVDCTVIAEEPKIGPHRSAMRCKVAKILQLSVEQVSIKATTTERLGFTGRGEGMAAQAVASIRMPAPR